MSDVDLSRLREKYKRIAEQEQRRHEETAGEGAAGAEAPPAPDAAAAGPDAGARLDASKICPDCGGTGVLRSITDMGVVLERTCRRCDGDCVILGGQ